jgi:isoquinoline 1-oxidoreductase beta subunit
LPDELDVPLAAVRVVTGQPEPALRLQPVNEMYAGASFGIRFWHDRIRRACAQARGALVQAAAARLNVPAAELGTAEGRVAHAASGRAIAYGELVEAAARLPLTDAPVLKPAAERRVTGRPEPRFDIPAKTNGSAVYGHDIRLPGMAYAVAKLSPVFGAELDGFDRASIAGMRGVIDVVPLKTGVAVVAENSWAAMEGAKRLAVRWKATPEQGLDSAEVTRRLRAGLDAPEAMRPRNEGDVDAALRGAARVVEAVYEAPYLAHAMMETENATVRIDGDKVEVWSSTQHQDWCVRDAARVAGVPPANVRIHTPMTGGGFGRRLHTEVVEQATIVAKAVGRPVKLIWSREDEFAQSYWRPAFAARLQAALDAQGRLVGLKVRAAGQSVMADYRPACSTARCARIAPSRCSRWPTRGGTPSGISAQNGRGCRRRRRSGCGARSAARRSASSWRASSTRWRMPLARIPMRFGGSCWRRMPARCACSTPPRPRRAGARRCRRAARAGSPSWTSTTRSSRRSPRSR